MSLIRRIVKVAAVALLGFAVVGCCIPPTAGIMAAAVDTTAVDFS